MCTFFVFVDRWITGKRSLGEDKLGMKFNKFFKKNIHNKKIPISERIYVIIIISR